MVNGLASPCCQCDEIIAEIVKFIRMVFFYEFFARGTYLVFAGVWAYPENHVGWHALGRVLDRDTRQVYHAYAPVE